MPKWLLASTTEKDDQSLVIFLCTPVIEYIYVV